MPVVLQLLTGLLAGFLQLFDGTFHLVRIGSFLHFLDALQQLLLLLPGKRLSRILAEPPLGQLVLCLLHHLVLSCRGLFYCFQRLADGGGHRELQRVGHLCVALCLVLVARLAHQVVHTLQIVGINFLESGLFFALQMQALAHTFGAGLGTAHVFVAVLCYGKGRNAAHKP